MSDVIFEGQQLILVCSVTVSEPVDTNSINLTVVWSGPDAPVSVTPATKISSTNYESRLVISELVSDHDNGSTYTCTAKLSSVTDQVHILSSSNSDHYNIIIDGMEWYTHCNIMFINSIFLLYCDSFERLTFKCESVSDIHKLVSE